MFKYGNPIYYTSEEYIKEKRKSYRQSKAYFKWRKHILERDGHKCARCGSTDDLHVHHIKQYYDNVFLRLKNGNGVVLCKSCHERLHPWMNKDKTQEKPRVLIRKKVT